MNINFIFFLLPSLVFSELGMAIDLKWLSLIASFLLIPIFIKKTAVVSKFDIVIGIVFALIVIYNVLILASPLASSAHFYLVLFIGLKLYCNSCDISYIKLFQMIILSSFLLFVASVAIVIANGEKSHLMHLTGFYYNENHFSLLLSFALLGSLYLYKFVSKHYYFAVLISASLISFLQSRTYALVCLGLIVLSFIFNRQDYKKYLLVILSFVAISFVTEKVTIDKKFDHGSRLIGKTSEIKEERRFIIWKKSAKLFLKKPLGYGLNSFAFIFNFNQQPLDSEGEVVVFDSPHNEFVRIVFELGIFGILLIILIILSLIYYFIRFRSTQSRETSFLVEGFILISIIDCCLQFPFDRSIYYFMSLVVIAKLKFKTVYKLNSKALVLLILVPASYLTVANYAKNYELPQPFRPVFCKLWVSESMACLKQVRAMPPLEGEKAIRYNMKQHIYNFHYWQALGLLEFQNGKVKEGCESLSFYNKLTYYKYDNMKGFVKFKCSHLKLNKINISNAIEYKGL